MVSTFNQLSLIALSLLSLSTVQAINDFKQCLECIHDNFEEEYYYCDERGGSCRPSGDMRCEILNMYHDYVDCVNVVEDCATKMMTNGDFNSYEEHEIVLVPGHGCFMEIDRALNGSWGQLRVVA